MKLFYAPPSPYARKVLITAIETGQADLIQKIASAPHPIDRDAKVVAENPLGKVPTLVTEDGLVLFDSRVIAEYLDSRSTRRSVFPADGAARWTALAQQALGDGLLDAALLVRYERTARPAELRWALWEERQFDKIHSALQAIEAQAATLGQDLTIGTITLACALGYLDHRFPEFDWRTAHPQATRWFAAIEKHESIRVTAAPVALAA